MTLDNLFKKALDYAKLQALPASKDRMRDYVSKYDLKDYFNEDIPEEEREKYQRGLEAITNETMEKFSTETEGKLRKTTAKGTMGLAVLNDIHAYISKVPIDNVTALGYVLFLAKSVAEVPALARLVKKSGGWYGADSAGWDVAKYLLMKPVRYLIPAIGPALESGAFERLVKKRIRKEIKREFIKRFGKYETLDERLTEKLSRPLKEVLYIQEPEEEYRDSRMAA